jgi:hypothetical protein
MLAKACWMNCFSLIQLFAAIGTQAGAAMMMSALRSKLSVLVQRRMRVERRSCKRVVPPCPTICLLQSPDGEQRITGVVHDLSLRGIAVLVDRNYPSGSSLHVLLVNASHTFSVEVDMKVVRCFPSIDERFLVAGPFLRPLLHDEMVPFII